MVCSRNVKARQIEALLQWYRQPNCVHEAPAARHFYGMGACFCPMDGNYAFIDETTSEVVQLA